LASLSRIPAALGEKLTPWINTVQPNSLLVVPANACESTDRWYSCAGIHRVSACSGDAALARDQAHLTSTAAGQIARQANVRRVEQFHFSARYAGEEERILGEVMAALRNLAS
jgi:hypothetical protein